MIESKTEKKNAKETLLHSGTGQWKQIILVRILRDAGFNIQSQFTYSISYCQYTFSGNMKNKFHTFITYIFFFIY